MDYFDAVKVLGGSLGNKTETASSGVSLATGMALTDSDGGYVSVDFEGVTVSSDGGQGVTVATSVDVRKGDTVQVSLKGADGTGKAPLVIGVIGGGDRTKQAVDKAQTDADAANAAAGKAQESADKANAAADELAKAQAEADKATAQLKADSEAHEQEIAGVKSDIADFKSTAEATYSTKTEVDDKTGAITKTLAADYTKTADLASTDAVKAAKAAGTAAQSNLDAYKANVSDTYAEKTELTEAVNQLKSTMTSNYSSFVDYRQYNDAALSKAQSDAVNAQSTIDSYKQSNDQAVADAKAAGTTAQDQLSAYKGTNDQAVADAKAAGISAQSNLDSYKTATNQRLDELKNIADNAIESFYLKGAPTASNPPASTWTTDALKKQHSGDMYVDTDTGYSYRWSGAEWVQIKDSDVTKALKEIETVKTDYATKSEVKVTNEELSGKVEDYLSTAKTYTDSSIETEVTNRNAAIQAKADSISLEVSKSYTKSDTFAAYQSDADSRIATANSNASTAKSTAQTAASDAATAKTQSSTAVSTANTASSNASKAVTTANTASSNASAAVSTANGAKTTANQAASTANSASSTANEAKSTVDGMQIGGRNLALNSAKLDIAAGKDNRYVASYSAGLPIVERADGMSEVRATSIYRGIGVFANTLDLNAGDEVVFSAFAHAFGADSNLSFFAMTIDASGARVTGKLYIDDQSLLRESEFLGTIEAGVTKKLAVKIKWTDEAKSIIDGGGTIVLTFQVYSQVASGNYVSFYAPKLERGTKATDWTPAPEDVDSAVADAKKAGTDAQTDLDAYKRTVVETYATKASLKVQEDRISTEVSARAKTDTTVANLSTKIDQTATSLSTEVAAREQTDSNLSDLSTKVTQNATSLTTEIADRKEDVNGVRETANATATMIRQYAGGVLVGKTGAAIGALVNADGSFDVVKTAWTNGNPTIVGTIGSWGGSRWNVTSGNFSMLGTAESIAFYDTGTLIAYIGNSRFHAVAGSFDDSVDIGGKYSMRIASDGKLVLGAMK